MKKIIGYLFPEKSELGMRLTFYALLVGIPFVALAFAGFAKVGYWGAVMSIVTGIIGFVIHLIINWKIIFYRKSK